MKGLTKTILIAVLAVVFLSIFPQKIPSQGPFLYCVVNFLMQNQDRYCYGDDLEAECGDECWPVPDMPWFMCHTPPFGNWGIRSNLGDKWNDDQFQGWKWNDDWHHWDWNSCTGKDPWKAPSRCDGYYNYIRTDGYCWEQKQKDSTGINTYAGGVNYMEIPRQFQDDG